MLRKHQEEQEKLELKNVSKSFGDNRVLDNISLNVETGNIVSILGPSGCGKTTLLNVILGLTDLTGGQILFDGEDVSRLPMKKRGFNIVFQDFALFPNTMLAMDEIKSAFESLRGHSPADPDIDAIYSVFEPSLLKVLPECSALKPFVPECMDYLRRYGVKIGSTTGYTAKMMDVVVPCARDAGYSTDCLVTPDEVGGRGRPYPYMIFENLRRLGIQDTRGVAKIGDTVSDIEEGLNDGLFTVGVTEGSSVMGLSESEFSALSEKEREEAHLRAAERFFTEGANLVICNLGEISLVKAAVEAL